MPCLLFLLHFLLFLPFSFLPASAFPFGAADRDLQNLEQWCVGSMVSATAVATYGEDRCFRSIPLPDSILHRMKGNSLPEGCSVRTADLRYLRLLHRDASGSIFLGEMVCHKDVAERLAGIFHRLYREHYPIERMMIVDRYGADDERSMSANNTSCFNFRRVAGSRRLSAHSMGKAVDINPLYNPCVRTTSTGRTVVSPIAGNAYADRSKASPYRLSRGDLCHRLFLQQGFQWGGAWHSVKDYQHFELSR